MRNTTLGFIVKGNKILLAMKKRWFWADLYNGIGGKQEKWETIQQAMIREAKEEIGIDISDLQQVWILNFYFEENPDWNQKVHVFKILNYTGEPMESEEMKPYWFDVDNLPFDKMWEDDRIWFKDFINGKNFEYTFYFNKDGKLWKREKIS